MNAHNKNEKVITLSRGCHGDYCVCGFVKACQKNDSIVSWNSFGRSKRCARHDDSDGDDDNDHEDDDENIDWISDFESLLF